MWLWRSKPPLPAGRELTAGSLGNSRKGSHTARGPWIFHPLALGTIRLKAQKGKYSRTNLSLGPQVASPCLMHEQDQFTINNLGSLQRFLNLLREAARCLSASQVFS